MIAKLFIKKLARRYITTVVEKYVTDEHAREQCINCLTQIIMDIAKAIGYREFIKLMWYAKNRWNMQRVIEDNGNIVTAGEFE